MEEQNNKIQKKKFTKTYVITSIVSFVVSAGIFCMIVFWFKGPLPETGTYAFYKQLSDGASVTGIIVFSVGALSWVGKQGFFDFASFGFKQLGTMLFNKKAKTQYTYEEYLVNKQEGRKDTSNFFIPIMIVGFMFLLAAVIINFCK